MTLRTTAYCGRGVLAFMGKSTVNAPAIEFLDYPATAHEHDLAEFILDRQARNLTPKTLLWYTHSLGVWVRYSNLQATQDITPGLLRRFLLHLAEQGHNAGGVANIFGALKAFLNWYESELADTGWQNPLRKVKNPRRPQEPLEPLPMAHFKAMLAQCERHTLTGDRDRAMLLVLLDTGVRWQELTDLRLGDLDIATGAILVRSGKGRKPRTVFFGAITKRALLAYFRHRHKRADDGVPARQGDGVRPPDQRSSLLQAARQHDGAARAEHDDPLWIHALTGTRLSRAGIREVVRRRAGQAGLDMPGMHAFRRAFAVNSLRAGMDIVTLQRLLGHTSLNVINRYLKLLTEDLQAAHRLHGAVDSVLGRGPPGA